MKKIKLLSLLLAAVISGTVLTSCGDSENSSASDTVYRKNSDNSSKSSEINEKNDTDDTNDTNETIAEETYEVYERNIDPAIEAKIDEYTSECEECLVWRSNDSNDYDESGEYIMIVKILNDDIEYINIPDEIKGRPVKVIQRDAFKNNTKIKAVRVGNNVKSIQDNAFASCTSLEYVTLPDGLVNLGWNAFLDTAVKNNTTEGVIYVDGWAVGLASSQSEVKLKKNTRGIAENAFSMIASENCKEIVSVDIPDVPVIPGAFGDNYKLKSVKIGDGVEKIGVGAFGNCVNLTDVQLGKNIKTIHSGAFGYCKALQNIELPDSLEKVGIDAFHDTGITDLKLPDNAVYVEDYFTRELRGW